MNDNIDLGNMTSKEIGNLMTKPLVERGEELANTANNNQQADYGDLPSRTLATLGKQVVNSQTNQY